MKRSEGMTLLEVLVALVIFSLAAMAVLRTSASQVRGMGRFEQLTVAGWVAENEMMILRLDNVWPAEQWTHGQSEMLGETWYWRWRGVATSDSGLRAITLEVSDKPDGVNTLATLTAWVTKS